MFIEQCTIHANHCLPALDFHRKNCLGNSLPYALTSSEDIFGDNTYSLEAWTALRVIPACWDKLKFFLCSVYIPECFNASYAWHRRALFVHGQLPAPAADADTSSAASKFKTSNKSVLDPGETALSRRHSTRWRVV
ncbi:unnamed protein product, partial [Protopolystoma xenopodis]